MSKRTKLLLIAAIGMIFGVVTLPLVGRVLIIEMPIKRADAIIVLSGSAVYKERTRYAAELYRKNVAPIIIITNDGERAGWSTQTKSNPRFVELEQRELIANGVLPDSIVLLPGSVSGTDQEALALAAELDARPLRSVLIVTSAYHTRRSLRIFRKLASETGVEFGIVHPPLDQSDPQPFTWWMSIRGWREVGNEVVKTIAYYIYY
jgi:uncharacterized SAM-binding protein YcdF (DUF218 family)